MIRKNQGSSREYLERSSPSFFYQAYGMKAIQITAFGGPEVMQYVDLPDPVAGSSEIVLDVTAVGINYADTHQTENSYLSPS